LAAGFWHLNGQNGLAVEFGKPKIPFCECQAGVAFQGERRTLFEPRSLGEFGHRLEKARLAWVTLARGSLFSPLFWRDKKRFACRASPTTVEEATGLIFK
jgi:hypothetical protein